MALNLGRLFRGRPNQPANLAEENGGLDTAPETPAGEAALDSGFTLSDDLLNQAGGAPDGGQGLRDIEIDLVRQPSEGAGVKWEGPDFDAGKNQLLTEFGMPGSEAFTGSDEELGALIAWLRSNRLIDTSTGEIVWADEVAAGQVAVPQGSPMLDWLRQNNLVEAETGAAGAAALGNNPSESFSLNFEEIKSRLALAITVDGAAGNDSLARSIGPGGPAGFMVADGQPVSYGFTEKLGQGTEFSAVQDGTSNTIADLGKPAGILPYLEQSPLRQQPDIAGSSGLKFDSELQNITVKGAAHAPIDKSTPLILKDDEAGAAGLEAGRLAEPGSKIEWPNADLGGVTGPNAAQDVFVTEVVAGGPEAVQDVFVTELVAKAGETNVSVFGFGGGVDEASASSAGAGPTFEAKLTNAALGPDLESARQALRPQELGGESDRVSFSNTVLDDEGPSTLVDLGGGTGGGSESLTDLLVTNVHEPHGHHAADHDGDGIPDFLDVD